MAIWEISHDNETNSLKLTYTGKDGKAQDCGTCEPRLEGQLLDWLFSPGQLDAFDVVVMKGQRFYCYPRRVKC